MRLNAESRRQTRLSPYPNLSDGKTLLYRAGLSLPGPDGRATIKPCLPRLADAPPTDNNWIHEIKHDGFRILAKWNAGHVRLFTRNGFDFALRFPRIVEAIESLPARSCYIDGEAIVVDASGLSVFDLCVTGNTTAPLYSAPST